MLPKHSFISLTSFSFISLPCKRPKVRKNNNKKEKKKFGVRFVVSTLNNSKLGNLGEVCVLKNALDMKIKDPTDNKSR